MSASVNSTSTATPSPTHELQEPFNHLADAYSLWQGHPHQLGKDAFGLDHSQVRTYPALLRHLVLAMAALAVTFAVKL